MLQSFSQWLKNQELNEVALKQLASPDTQTTLDEETFQNDRNRGIRHYLINKPGEVLKALIKIPTAKEKLAGKTYELKANKLNPENYKPNQILNIKGNSVKWSETTRTGLRLKHSPLHGLKDITDAFDKTFANQNARYHINIFGNNPHLGQQNEDLYAKWLELSKHQLTQDKDERSQLMMKSFLGGTDAAKAELNKRASEAQSGFWSHLAQRALAGEDVTKLALDAGFDDVKNQNRFYDDQFLDYLKRKNATAVVDQLKLTGKLGPLAKEDKQIVDILNQADRLALLSPENLNIAYQENPEVKSVLDNSNAMNYAKILDLKHIAKWIQDNLEHQDFINKLTKAKTELPKPTTTTSPLDKLLGNK